MTLRRYTLIILFLALIVGAAWFPAVAEKDSKLADNDVSPLVGMWEIYQTKEPGQPYRRGYKGRPFVLKGPNAFTIVLEYRKDGTFTRISRVGDSETKTDGKWKLDGHELRQQTNGARETEVLYVRFDGPNEFTSIEVFEDTTDPGLFAKFRRISE